MAPRELVVLLEELVEARLKLEARIELQQIKVAEVEEKLERSKQIFELLEESLRYSRDTAKIVALQEYRKTLKSIQKGAVSIQNLSEQLLVDKQLIKRERASAAVLKTQEEAIRERMAPPPGRVLPIRAKEEDDT